MLHISAIKGRIKAIQFMLLNEDFLDQLIGNQQRAIRYYLLFASIFPVVGIAILALSSRLASWLNTEALKAAFQIGGALVSGLCAFPLKEILNRKEKVGVFETIKTRLHSLDQAREAANETERKRLDDLLWQVVEKTALRD